MLGYHQLMALIEMSVNQLLKLLIEMSVNQQLMSWLAAYNLKKKNIRINKWKWDFLKIMIKIKISKKIIIKIANQIK